MQPSPPEDGWKLSPETAHPAAAAALDRAWYWDPTEEFSPFGNDDGSDALYAYRQWRMDHPGNGRNARPTRFLRQWLRMSGVRNRHWHVMNCRRLLRLIKRDRFSFGTRDRVIVSLAFAQIVLDAQLDPKIRRLALSAVRRQLLPCLLELWPQSDAIVRKERFTHMLAVLERPWSG